MEICEHNNNNLNLVAHLMQKVKFANSIIVPKGSGKRARIKATPSRSAYFRDEEKR